MPDSILSLTGKRWLLKRKEAFKVSDDIPSVLAKERGILLGSELRLSDPFLFPEMPRAVDRIESAIASKQPIGIFGDYDADGITGTAQLVRFFRRRGIEPVVVLPHRERDGYGLKPRIVDHFHDHGVRLLVTVDTGIASHAEIEHAAKHGIDVIVTDHHHAHSGRPPAFAVIHPLIPYKYPNEHLCGSGVVFTLVRALEHGAIWQGIDEDITLAAIGTIGDLVPLTGENRVLVMHALRLMKKLPAESPLRQFFDHVRSKGRELSSIDIAFRVVPRINASGRMADPRIALDALLGDANALEQLHQLNTDRQELVQNLIEEARKIVDHSQLFLALQSKKFTAGVVGLIAGTLTQEHGKPSLAASIRVDGTCTASLRSVPQVNVIELLHHPSVRPLLTSCGGHAQAAGCTFVADQFSTLQQALNAAVLEKGMTLEELIPTLFSDGEISPDHITIDVGRQMLSLQPFGQANDEPTFLLRRQKIQRARAVGSESTHLQCFIGSTKAIGFKLAGLLESLNQSTHHDILCSIGVNVWNGKEEVQVVIKDIRRCWGLGSGC